MTVAVIVPVMRDVSLAMLPSTLSRVLSDQTLPEGWVGTILDHAGISVARSRSPERYVGKRRALSLAALIAASPAGSGPSTTLEGQPVVTAWSRSPSIDAAPAPAASLNAPKITATITAWRALAASWSVGTPTAKIQP